MASHEEQSRHLNAQLAEKQKEDKRLRESRDDLGALCEDINHALWPDPDASHDTLEAPEAISKLQAEAEGLRSALRDCIEYVDCDNLTMQTKHARWQAVLDGGPWDRSNVEVSS